MTDHHDFPDDPVPFDDYGTWDDLPHDDVDGLLDPGHEEPHDVAAVEPYEPAVVEAHHQADVAPEPPADEPLGGDISEMSSDVFPPAVDVGELPEPVDGFPWTDPATLGPTAEAATADEPVQPAELAEYAATDLPPDADPWQVLADSDDPATAALARWWSQN